MEGPLWQWSATDLAQAIRDREISSQEVIKAHLDRIEAVNCKVNAVTVVLVEDSLRLASEADKKIADRENLGRLHGVPVTLKENIDLVGSATTHGVVELKNSMPKTDAPVVSYLKQAGAIPIGRTNMPDFGLRWHTNNELRGATLNPWDPSRTPGGSSGGEAVAIATGMSPLGVGNDMGGSVRYPSQCCGISALKPSFGRISRIATSIFPNPPMYYEQIASVNGPMARHVKDLRLALSIMSQPDSSDPWWTPALTLTSENPVPVRVAVTTDPAGYGSSPAVKEGVRKAADVLANAGYAVEDVDLPSTNESGQIIQQLFDMEFTSILPQILPIISPEARTILERTIVDTKPDLTIYMNAIAERHRIAQEWSLFMKRYPLVLGPVSTLQPFEVGYDLSGSEQLSHFVRSMRLTEICNLLGLASVATPVHVVDGLPQGIQIIGPRFHEETCLDAAQIIEQKQGILTPIEPRDPPIKV